MRAAQERTNTTLRASHILDRSLADSTLSPLSSRFVLPASSRTSLRCSHPSAIEQEIALYEPRFFGSAKDHSSQTQTPTSLLSQFAITPSSPWLCVKLTPPNDTNPLRSSPHFNHSSTIPLARSPTANKPTNRTAHRRSNGLHVFRKFQAGRSACKEKCRH